MTDWHNDRDEGTWTNETLPIKVRRDLLKRELSRVLADRNVMDAAVPAAGTDETRPSAGDHPDKKDA